MEQEAFHVPDIATVNAPRTELPSISSSGRPSHTIARWSHFVELQWTADRVLPWPSFCIKIKVRPPGPPSLCFSDDRTVLGAVPDVIHWFFRLTKEMGGDEPLSLRFPSETLEMLSCIIADEPRDAPYDLSKVLDTIVEADPRLAVDVRFRRLAAIVAGR